MRRGVAVAAAQLILATSCLGVAGSAATVFATPGDDFGGSGSQTPAPPAPAPPAPAPPAPPPPPIIDTGSLLVVDGADRRVVLIEPDGEETTLGADMEPFVEPGGIDVCPDGSVVFADTGADAIYEFNEDEYVEYTGIRRPMWLACSDGGIAFSTAGAMTVSNLARTTGIIVALALGDQIQSMSTLSNGDLAVVLINGTVLIVDATTGELRAAPQLDGVVGVVQALAGFCLGVTSGLISCFDNAGTATTSFESGVRPVALAANSGYLFVAAADGTITVIDLRTTQPVRTITRSAPPVALVAAEPGVPGAFGPLVNPGPSVVVAITTTTTTTTTTSEPEAAPAEPPTTEAATTEPPVTDAEPLSTEAAPVVPPSASPQPAATGDGDGGDGILGWPFWLGIGLVLLLVGGWLIGRFWVRTARGPLAPDPVPQQPADQDGDRGDSGDVEPDDDRPPSPPPRPAPASGAQPGPADDPPDVPWEPVGVDPVTGERLYDVPSREPVGLDPETGEPLYEVRTGDAPVEPGDDDGYGDAGPVKPILDDQAFNTDRPTFEDGYESGDNTGD